MVLLTAIVPALELFGFELKCGALTHVWLLVSMIRIDPAALRGYA